MLLFGDVYAHKLCVIRFFVYFCKIKETLNVSECRRWRHFFCDTEILFATNTINGIKESYY